MLAICMVPLENKVYSPFDSLAFCIGFESGSKAAAAGGTTTVVLMPLNALPAITTGALLKKSIAASEASTFDLNAKIQYSRTSLISVPSLL